MPTNGPTHTALGHSSQTIPYPLGIASPSARAKTDPEEYSAFTQMQYKHIILRRSQRAILRDGREVQAAEAWMMSVTSACALLGLAFTKHICGKITRNAASTYNETWKFGVIRL